MNYTVETYKDLLNEEEYGDQFIEEFKTVKELIGVSNPEELTVTTSEDVENEEEFNKFVEFISKLCSLDKIKEVVLDFDVLTLVEIEGINLIYYSNQIDVIILKVSDKEKFEQIFSQS